MQFDEELLALSFVSETRTCDTNAFDDDLIPDNGRRVYLAFNSDHSRCLDSRER